MAIFQKELTFVYLSFGVHHLCQFNRGSIARRQDVIDRINHSGTVGNGKRLGIAEAINNLIKPSRAKLVLRCESEPA